MEKLTEDQLKQLRCLSIEDVQKLYDNTNHRKEFWDKLGQMVIERAEEINQKPPAAISGEAV